MGIISITRPNSIYTKLNRWSIKINDGKVSKIKTNDTKEITVRDGTHIVQINAGGWV